MLGEFVRWAWGMLAITAINTAVLIAILIALARYGKKTE